MLKRFNRPGLLNRRHCRPRVVGQTEGVQNLADLTAVVNLVQKKKFKGLTGHGFAFCTRDSGPWTASTVPLGPGHDRTGSSIVKELSSTKAMDLTATLIYNPPPVLTPGCQAHRPSNPPFPNRIKYPINSKRLWF
ncbi:MAG: hypothetical protein QNJ61_12000 [Desulfobacterales bacterium]|nr:hypothetical protein [Desulfobacterales bacterium]